MFSKIVLTTGVLILMAGCANVTVTGKKYPPVAVEDVKVLFTAQPSCAEYEELGFIGTNPMRNQNAAVQLAREEAAKLGADYLSIQEVLVNNFNAAMVSGVALKCVVSSK